MNKFADLHCHPHMRSFNWLRESKFEKKDDKFHPWHVIVSKVKAKADGRRANAYSQSDLIKLKNGNLKLAFVSLYPMEKGWFKGREDIPQSTYQKALRSVTKNKFVYWLLDQNFDWVENLLLKLGKSKGNKLAVRDVLQGIFLKLPNRRIQFIQSDKYNYFEELIKERDFLLSKNNIETESDIFVPAVKSIFKGKKKLIRKCPEEFKATGTYIIAKNKDDIQRIINEENKMAFIFTIEGSNVFNSDESEELIISRIKQVKAWEDTPVFFISFAHHFNNFLCGHAHSIPDAGNLILDQSKGMNSGFTEKGINIIRYFLSLDENNIYNPDKFGRRILIDIKHLSARARKFYYDEVIKPCKNNNDNIPIVASHVAYSGIKTIDGLIANATKETDKDAVSTIDKPFNTWNINLSDEDIIEVFLSGGIIGINIDQRILAVPKKDKKRTYPDDYDISFFWDNLKAMMMVIINSELDNKEKVVDLFALGTDFDGYIDPLDKYPTVLEFKELRKALIKKIEQDDQKDKLVFGLDTTVFVDKVCFGNAYAFVLKNL